MVVWNLQHLVKDKSPDSLIKELKAHVADFKTKRTLLNPEFSPKAFADLLSQKEKISELASIISAHSQLWFTENTQNSQAAAHSAKISQELAEIDNDIMFFSLWFKQISDEQAKPLLDISGKNRYFLERIRALKKYTLTEKEEQIINLKSLSGSEALCRIYDSITNKFSYEFEGKKLTQEEMNQFKYSPKRELRVAAYEKVLGRYGEEKEVLSDIYRAIAADWVNESVKVRSYASPIAVRNIANDIPDEAVNSLLSVTKKNVGAFQKYFALKAKMLGMPSFDRYDLYAPSPLPEKKYPYEESKNIALETYKQFSEQAFRMASRIFDEQYVHSDVIPGKRSGAFCYSVTPKLPPYVMLNHVGNLHDLFTMMHEFGHGIHSLAAEKQTLFTFHATLPLAETASIFGEMLLAKRMLASASKEEKIAVLMKMLDGQYGSIGRQAHFVLFEQYAHEAALKGATVDDMSEVYLDNLRSQFGSIVVPDVFRNEWIYIPHIFHSPFYCYSYAFGNLLVLALYKRFEQEGQEFVPKYLKLLSYGGSKAPQEVLAELGIDITKESFWQGGFDIIEEEIRALELLSH